MEEWKEPLGSLSTSWSPSTALDDPLWLLPEEQELQLHLTEATVVWEPFYMQPNMILIDKLEKSMCHNRQAYVLTM